MLLRLLSAPFTAPIHGAMWLAREIHDAAEAELNDPSVLRAELTRLEDALEAGEIDEETFEELEEGIISRIQASKDR